MIKKRLSTSLCLTMMKWTTFLYTWIAICLLTAHAAESHGQVNFESKLSLKERTMSLRASLREISKQTGVDFAYNSKTMPLNKTIRWEEEISDLQMVMNRLVAEFGFKYETVGNTLVLLPEDEEYLISRPLQQTEVRSYHDTHTNSLVIEGLVIDAETKEPVGGATIELKSSAARAISGRDGRFILVIPQS